MYTLSLEIINKCNLNCTYCYLGEKKNTYMRTCTGRSAKGTAGGADLGWWTGGQL